MYRQKCPKCSTVSGRFHLCTYGASTEVVTKAPKTRKVVSEEAKRKMREASNARWEKVRKQKEDELQSIIRLYLAGTKNPTEIANILNAHPLTVKRNLAEAQARGLIDGLVRRNVAPESMLEIVTDLYVKEDHTIEEIAIILDISRWKASDYVKKAQARGMLTVRPRAPRAKN